MLGDWFWGPEEVAQPTPAKPQFGFFDFGRYSISPIYDRLVGEPTFDRQTATLNDIADKIREGWQP